MKSVWETKFTAPPFPLKTTPGNCSSAGSGPVTVTKIINNAMVEVQEYEVKNPQTYVACRSNIRLAKRMGQKDVNPLFKLPRLPVEAVKDLADELSEFELPARQLDAELADEFHSQSSEIHHRGKFITAAASPQSPP